MVLATQQKSQLSTGKACPKICGARVVGALECVCQDIEDLLAKWDTMGGVCSAIWPDPPEATLSVPGPSRAWAASRSVFIFSSLYC